jgi:2-oxoglutarate dehydrogenase E1 component
MGFFHNISPEWIEELYRLWLKSPERVDSQWRDFFAGFELGREEGECLAPEWALKQSAVQTLIHRYRDIGHLLACTDPLSPCKIGHPLLSLTALGLAESDLERVFHTRRFYKESATLHEILDVMQATYCHSIGVEFMHIQEPSERQWLIDRMEPVRNRPALSMEEKLAILAKLQEATIFEDFLHKRYPGQKRFSLEGGETVIPLLHTLVRRGARAGIRDIILGMSHRGRLNVLANVFHKPYENIFAEFDDNVEYGIIGEGDVKYHKGYSTDARLPRGEQVHLSLAFNPSHLEAVDPVVEGKSRARQDRYGRDGKKLVLPILLHGDAAFAGQGMVAETLNLSQLEGYGTGGTIHVVLNNQIGFTTLPADARSTKYATDVAKMLMAPIFHIHGEDPEAAVHVAGLALEYRQSFGRDAVVEVICYRRYGHSEGDEPYFTQPLMYEKIKERQPICEIYQEELLAEGVDEGKIRETAGRIKARLEEASGRQPAAESSGFQGAWTAIRRDYSPVPVVTGAAEETLREVAEILAKIPDGFTCHHKVAEFLRKRFEAVSKGEGLDWGNGEALAFAAILREGVSIRLSGQDSRRGTFSHRHSTLYDQVTGEQYVSLAGAAAAGAEFRAFDSMLSEAAVLGFEYGYSVESPGSLTIWEAQFGDFANGAQVIIDQFIASGETKWERASGLVMLLPHGYEGQGAEHSSARIERYLQLCADNNIQVTYPSTPAQYFHLLRRQVKEPFRRPLVVFTPKSLLRHPRCVSRLAEFSSGAFLEIIPDNASPARVRAVLICSGKLYYELLERKERDRRDDIALIRIEQLYPLCRELLGEAMAPFAHAENCAWVQEEPANMGAWTYIRPHLVNCIGKEPRYVGRPEAPAPAIGSHRLHKEEQEKIISDAFSVADNADLQTAPRTFVTAKNAMNAKKA